jgi:hypothetical protein
MLTNTGILRPTARIIFDWVTHLGQTIIYFLYKIARSFRVLYLIHPIISIPICRYRYTLMYSKTDVWSIFPEEGQ